MQDGDELRHLRHLHTACQHDTDTAAHEKRHKQNHVVLGNDAENGGKQRDCHTNDAIPVTASSSLLIRQAAERQDKKNCCCDV